MVVEPSRTKGGWGGSLPEGVSGGLGGLGGLAPGGGLGGSQGVGPGFLDLQTFSCWFSSGCFRANVQDGDVSWTETFWLQLHLPFDPLKSSDCFQMSRRYLMSSVNFRCFRSIIDSNKMKQ